MKKWNLIIDVEKCNACNNCFLAIKDEYGGNDWGEYCAPQPAKGARWLNVERHERGQEPIVDVTYYPVTCNHCDNAPCINSNTVGIINKREDGIVTINPRNAKGHEDIVKMCPFGQIHWNEELSIPQIWPFDAHLLDKGWNEPRISQVCPTEAIKSLLVEDSEIEKIAAIEKLATIPAPENVKPRIYYKNFDRVTKAFVAGSFYSRVNEIEDCIEGLEVKLLQNDNLVAITKTDNFGDFKFDGLEIDNSKYVVSVIDSNSKTQIFSLSLSESKNIGAICIN